MTAPAPAPDQLLDAARAWHDAGYAVIPSHEDGGKRPFGPWKDYQAQRPSWDRITSWLASGHYTGIGIISGAASGNVELLEIEGPLDAAVQRLGLVAAKAAEYAEVDMPALLARIASGCVEQSAGGGLHLFIRITDGPAKGNTKLAYTGQGTDRKVIAETRGEGGFVVVAPTPGRKGHPEGTAYLFINGGHPSKTVPVTGEERDLLHLLFTMALDEPDEGEIAALLAEQARHTTPRAATPERTSGAFDAYREVDWRDILEPAGWTWSHRDGERDHWTRPGKPVRDGTSATTIPDGPMYVFSSNAGMPTERGLSKGQVYAHLHHGGDLSAAARALTGAGYGPGEAYTPLPAWQAAEAHAAPVLADAEQADLHDLAVRRKYAELMIVEDARALIATAKAGQAPALTAVGLPDLLAQPDEPVRYRVDGLWPAEGRVMLAAAAKSGKTTMVAANLIPALVDGGQFLGAHHARPVAGNVVLLNMEVSETTLRRWMRDAPIHNPHRVIVANLRGRATALALATDAGRKRFADFLRAHEAEAVILDPLAPVLAALGLDENSNADVASFYSWWGEALALAGVADDVIVHHTGHAGQRSRGASRLLDEPDAIWTLTRDAEADDETPDGFTPIGATRYLSAYGRDVEMAAQSLAYQPATRGLILTGMGRGDAKDVRTDDRIRKAMKSGRPMTRSQIVKAAGGKRQATWDRVGELIDDGTLTRIGRQEYVWPDVVEVP